MEPHQINMTLVSFTMFTNKNEDVFAGMLTELLQPHETVIVAVSLLKEKWPDGHPQQKIAEDASKKSELAKAFFKNIWITGSEIAWAGRFGRPAQSMEAIGTCMPG